MGDRELDARLRRIVIAHTVVGGHPDTMAIARDAYALAKADAREADGNVTMERTVWRGSSGEDEAVPMDAWIAQASHDRLSWLLDEAADADRLDAATCAALADTWRESARAAGVATDDHEGDPRVAVSFHWDHGDARRLRAAVARLRPDHLQPDPSQGSMF